jgi:hypothetical protein
MKIIKVISILLIIIGSINWGLWGLFKYDLIQDFFGFNNFMLARLFYILIGVSGIYAFFFIFQELKNCNKGK